MFPTFEAALRLPVVDGDPHFMIELPDKDDALCFNINNKPGTIFSLVRDPESGQNSNIHSTSPLTVHLSTFAGSELNINFDTLCGFTQTHFEQAKFSGGAHRDCRFLRHRGQWSGHRRQEDPPQWCHQHLLQPLWDPPPGPGGEAGGQHAGHLRLPEWEVDQDTVVGGGVAQRNQVRDSRDSTISSMSPRPHVATVASN